MSNGAQRGDGCSSASRSRGWTAIAAPVADETAALSPTWSQWPWVETTSFNVQSRAASSSRIQASDGIAVSIAIASRVPGSQRTWTFVASGPTTRLTRSSGQLPPKVSSSSTYGGIRKPNSAPPVVPLQAHVVPAADSTSTRTTKSPIPAPWARIRAASVR